MKKIGIITISRTNNYGAELQAYSTQKKLRLIGYEAELIDYVYYKHKRHIESPASRPDINFQKSDRVKHFFLYRMVSPVVEDFGSLFIKKISLRKKNFHNFHKQNTKFSNEYRKYEDLKKAQLEYDVIVAGSDQIWNPSAGTSLAPYFLDFVPKSTKKISFASSFGVSKIEEEYYQLYKKYIDNLDAIAVREDDGVDLVKEIAGREAKRVLDPTLLMSKEEWMEVIVGNSCVAHLKANPYIIIYMLHESETLINIANYLKEKLGLKVIMLTKRAYSNKSYSGIEIIEYAGPAEYIELFMSASFVLTNSFHGTAFATNFNVPFFAILNPERKNNSRMINFLKMTRLEDRIVWEDIKEMSLLDKYFECNFIEANKILDAEKKSSVAFLKEHLG